MQYSDQDILKALRQGDDHKALGALYKSLLPKVKRMVPEADKEEAKDIFQEALMIFYKQVMTNKFDEKYEIAAFVFSVSRNLWINRIKRKNRMINIDSSELDNLAEDSILEELMLNERKEEINLLFSKLEDKCKELLTYSIYQDLLMEDVCLRMGFTSVNAASTALYRCKKYLMDLVKNNQTIKNRLEI